MEDGPPWWQRGIGWHLDGAAVSLSMTDRLQLGDPDKRSRSQSRQRPGCQPFNSSPAESATQPIRGSRYSVYSPSYLFQTRRAEPSLTISPIFISRVWGKKSYSTRVLSYAQTWMELLINKSICERPLLSNPVHVLFWSHDLLVFYTHSRLILAHVLRWMAPFIYF